MSDPVYFIFPILTSLSFYEKAKKYDIETNDAQIIESSNYKNTDVDGTKTVETTTETTVAVVNIGNDGFPVVETEKKFSVRQSNILYLLFCLSSSLCIFGDLWYQWIRGNKPLPLPLQGIAPTPLFKLSLKFSLKISFILSI